MFYKSTLIILFSFFSFLGFGQIIGKSIQQYLKPYSGDTIFSDSVVYQFASLNEPRFSYEKNSSILSDSVEYLRNYHGILANLSRLEGEGSKSFALRIKKGEVSVFERVNIEVYGGRHLAIQASNRRRSHHPELATGDNYDFYNVKGGPLKEVTYDNLLKDVSTNEKSLKELQAFKRYRFLQIGLIGAGAGIVAASFLLQDQGEAKFTPMAATGVVIAGCSIFIKFPKKDVLKNAIDFYNE